MRYSVFRRVIASPYGSASRLSLHGTAVASSRCNFSDIQHLVLGASRQCMVADLLHRASEADPGWVGNRRRMTLEKRGRHRVREIASGKCSWFRGSVLS